MNVLFVASECAPFIKTGGLADVVGALPKALGQLGVKIKVVLPAYPALKDILDNGKTVLKLDKLHGGPAKLVAVTDSNIDLLLVDAPHLFDRPGNIYVNSDGKDWSDNDLRFGGFCVVAAKIAVEGISGWRPDLIHCHDWQAGLVPVYLRQMQAKPLPSIFTIHNIAFQGLFDSSRLGKLGISSKLFTPEGLEYFGNISFLKAGIAYSDKITTVSPTYARELMQAEFGMGFEGLLQARRGDLSGILNGIDLDTWDPENDPDLASHYSSRSLKRKAANRAEVKARFGLNIEDDAPLFCVVSRLSWQKGLDILQEVLPSIAGRGAGLALLGSGDKELETAFKDAARRYAGSVGVVIGYDEGLSHLIQGGSDAILIPSRFEPCGLTQLYGLRYGTLPVVARTGGLADTVIDANVAAVAENCATGFQFSPINAEALDHAIDRVCQLFKDRKTWTMMMRRAMRHAVGWDKSAEAYRDLYQERCNKEVA